MDLHVGLLTHADGEREWVLYERGKWSTPMAILSDREMEVLERNIKDARERADAAQGATGQ